MSAAQSKPTKQDIFQRLANEDEKQKIFDSLALTRMELSAKTDEGEIVKMKAIRHIQSTLSCEFAETNIKEFAGEVVLTFFTGGQKYFMKCPVRISKPGMCNFKTSSPLYILQRRDNFRVKVPSSYSTVIHYTDELGYHKEVSAEMFDISAGGCRLVHHQQMPNFSVDQKVDLELLIGKRDPISVKAQIRHKQEAEVDRKKVQVFGLEFVQMTPQFEAKLLAIVIDLHRELFSLWSTRDS